ncbi:hypothetical protein D9757_011472 [Collybiopsis confluens]|uniref:Uncharacterized protein n=1 Tax=Collybiopsis confluens TaxID=2823264 RepID=A0A8H5LQL0_9AGAR|nr:hypothetical protein D9757_011472 [Collybiopsis confluens]
MPGASPLTPSSTSLTHRLAPSSPAPLPKRTSSVSSHHRRCASSKEVSGIDLAPNHAFRAYVRALCRSLFHSITSQDSSAVHTNSRAHRPSCSRHIPRSETRKVGSTTHVTSTSSGKPIPTAPTENHWEGC